jgi:hypothetical protein
MLDEAWCDRCWDPDTDSACTLPEDTTTTTTTTTTAAPTTTTTTAEPTTTTEAPPSSILVSDAGSSEVNGIYLLNGTENDKNRYSKADNSFVIYWDIGGLWILRNYLMDIYYYNTSDTPTPPLDYSWNLQSGNPPPPTFSIIGR